MLGKTVLCSFAILHLAAAAAYAAPDVTRMWFSPPVVPDNYTQPVRFEAATTGSPPSVAFQYDGVDRPMYDDGTHGDLVAGDGVWSILFQPDEILGKAMPSAVFRPFIGYCKPLGGGNFNVFAEVWTPSIGLRLVQSIDVSTQHTGYVVNLAVPASELQATNFAGWAQRFYAKFPDAFDFLNFVLVPGQRGNRYHVGVRNDVSGIGVSTYNNSATYGSAGRLKGLNVFPISSLFDAGSNGFNHETGHQWLNFLEGTPFAPGVPHWPRGDIAINVMGFSIGGPGGAGGNYPYAFAPNGQGGYTVSFNQAPNANTTTFNSMELYLMGLVPADQVGTFFVLNDQNRELTNGQVLQPSEISPVTVNDVIAAAGVRTPDSSTSQKAFRVATIVVSEQLLDPYSISLYDWFAARAERTVELDCTDGFSTYTCKPFFVATGGRATMTASLSTTSPTTRNLTDLTGDRRSEITVWRPDSGVWFIRNSDDDYVSTWSVPWGAPEDVPIVGDFDNDRRMDIAVWRPSTGVWYVKPSHSNFIPYFAVDWGALGDTPVAGDYDGDGATDTAVWRPSDGIWYVKTSSTGYANAFAIQWGSGLLNDVPVPGDYDGDQISDIAVWRPESGIWYVRTSTTGYGSFFTVHWGADALNDVPVPGDFDGDGTTDIAVWRPGSGEWFVKTSASGYLQYFSVHWGLGILGDIPTVADFDGDGHADIAVWRPDGGLWYVLTSSSGYASFFTIRWGVGSPSDVPIGINPIRR